MTGKTVAKAAPAETKAPIHAGGAVAGFAPQTIDEAYRLAVALSGAGAMVPQHFQGKPNETMAAIMKGAEIGLSPMSALATIAVINGRPALWGDALPALVLRAGHMLDETVEGEGRDMVATATVTRGDTGQKITRVFTWADAEKAGLAKKQGPWQQYPKRMLQMRARGFAVRDGCADVMVGLGVAEELRDVRRSTMRDVTPDDVSAGILAALPSEGPTQPDDGEAETLEAETEAESRTTDEPEGEEADTMRETADRIITDIATAKDAADLAEIGEIWRPQIEAIAQAMPLAHERIAVAIEKRAASFEDA